MKYKHEYIKKKTKEFLEKNLWLVNMWREFDKVQEKYWRDIEKLNKKYTKLAKNYGLDSVELWSNFDGEICGIDINNGYNNNGFNFKKNRMLIDSSDLNDKMWKMENEKRKNR